MRTVLTVTLSAILLSAVFASADTVTFQPDGAASKDAYVSEYCADTNYGNESYISIGYDGSYFYDAYIDFDELDDYSGVTLNSAILSIFAISDWGTSSAYVLVGMADAPWSESTVTYNNGPLMESEPRTYFIAPNGGEWRAVDVTEIVADWLDGSHLNDGFALFKANDANEGVNLYSGEHPDPTYRPKLYLDYTPLGIESVSMGEIKAAFK